MEKGIKLPGFVSFITSPAGRWTRVIAGVVMIGAGSLAATPAGIVVAVLGVIPTLAGAFDVCVLGPLLGGSFRGDVMREQLHKQQGHPELGSQASSFGRA